METPFEVDEENRMSRRMIVIGLSSLIFLVGIVLAGLSNVSVEVLVEVKNALIEPVEGSRIGDMMLMLVIENPGTVGVNLTGSFQGYEEQPIFIIRDFEGRLVYSSPYFPAPSNIIEFEIDEAGLYDIEFLIIASNNTRLEIYQYIPEMRSIRVFSYLYYVAAPLAISGIVGVAAGLFVLSEEE